MNHCRVSMGVALLVSCAVLACVGCKSEENLTPKERALRAAKKRAKGGDDSGGSTATMVYINPGERVFHAAGSPHIKPGAKQYLKTQVEVQGYKPYADEPAGGQPAGAKRAAVGNRQAQGGGKGGGKAGGKADVDMSKYAPRAVSPQESQEWTDQYGYPPEGSNVVLLLETPSFEVDNDQEEDGMTSAGLEKDFYARQENFHSKYGSRSPETNVERAAIAKQFDVTFKDIRRKYILFYELGEISHCWPAN